MRPIRAACALLLVPLVMCLILPAPPVRSQGKKPPGTTKAPPVTKTKIEAKQFSGDFEQWGLTGSIEKGGSLTKEFRWSTNRSDVAAARYEIRMWDFPPPATYQLAVRLVGKKVLTQPLSPGAINYTCE